MNKTKCLHIRTISETVVFLRYTKSNISFGAPKQLTLAKTPYDVSGGALKNNRQNKTRD